MTSTKQTSRSKYSTTERYLIRYARKVWNWCAERRTARKRQERGKPAGTYYECEGCNKVHARNQTDVDHMESAAALEGIQRQPSGAIDWNAYYARLFCPASGLQILCKGCHKKKTAAESGQRARIRKEKKKK